MDRNITYNEDGLCIRYEESFDPKSVGETIVSLIGLAVILFNGIISILVLVNRKFPPLLAKQPLTIFISYIAGAIYILFSIEIYDCYPIESWAHYTGWCSARKFFGYLYFGFVIWTSCILSRMTRLYIIIVRRKQPLNEFVILFLYSLPGLVVAIIGQAMSGDEACNWITPVEGYHSFYRCSIKVPFLYLIIAISFAYMITAFIFVLLVRDVRKSFNEGRELKIQVLLAIIVFITSSALIYFGIDKLVVGRVVIVLLVILIVTACLWLSIAYPLVQCYWRKEEHLNQFRQQLHEDSREGVRRDSVVRPNSRISIFKKKDDFPLVKVPESIEESKSDSMEVLSSINSE